MSDANETRIPETLDATNSQTDEERKEWTVMFYFASDNPLAPGIVSQLKALKQAGFHREVNVIARFDPDVENTPAHVFDVNAVNKLRDEQIRAGQQRRAQDHRADN